jgi:hypothetical protein
VMLGKENQAKEKSIWSSWQKELRTFRKQVDI